MVRSPRTRSGGAPGLMRAEIGMSGDFAAAESGLSDGEDDTVPGATRKGEREFVFGELLRPEIPGEFFGLPPLTLIPGTTAPISDGEDDTVPGATRKGEREFVFGELLRPEIPGEFFGLPPLTLIPGTTAPLPLAPPALPPGLVEFPPVSRLAFCAS